MAKCWKAIAIAIVIAAGLSGLQAAAILVPNGSFESPATVFVDINIDNWQKGPKPATYDETGGFAWNQLTGTFKNSAPTSLDHLDNCDGAQAIWMFAIPDVELFQDYNSIDWNDGTPSHAFDARFEVGKSYSLTVAINGGGGGMSNGATVLLSLYYRDSSSNKVTVATTSITNSPDQFPSHTHLADFEVRVPAVHAGDAHAGHHIGVQLLSTVTTNLAGGYWDFDNVRLSAVQEPMLTGVQTTGGQFQFSLQSDPGLRFEILAATNISLPLTNWVSLGIVTNTTGIAAFSDASAPGDQRFFRARQLP